MIHPTITAHLDAQKALYAAEAALKLAAQKQAEIALEVLRELPDSDNLSEYHFLLNHDWIEITSVDDDGNVCIEYWTRGRWGGSDEAFNVSGMLDRLSPCMLSGDEETFKMELRNEVQAKRAAMYDRQIAVAQQAADAAQRQLEALRSLRNS